MRKTERLGLTLNKTEKLIVKRLAEAEGGLSQVAYIRRLIRSAAEEWGFWPTDQNKAITQADQQQRKLDDAR